MKTELLFKCNYCGHEQKGNMNHLGKKPNCPDCTDHPIMRIVKPKCISCGKPVNENTSLAGEFVHEKCIKEDGAPICLVCHGSLSDYEQLTYTNYCTEHAPVPVQQPPHMCHGCGMPIYVSNTIPSTDGNFYHEHCEKIIAQAPIPQHAPGAKCDYSKNRLDLVLGGFSLALQEVGKVGTFGAKKYTDNGWMHVPDGINRYKSALLRHYFEDAAGHKTDDEIEFNNKKLHHMAAVAWNALAALDLMLRKEETQHAQLEMDKQ